MKTPKKKTKKQAATPGGNRPAKKTPKSLFGGVKRIPFSDTPQSGLPVFARNLS